MIRTKQNLPLFRPRKKPLRQRLGRLFTLLCCAAAVAAIYGAWRVNRFSSTPVVVEPAQIIEFPRGTGILQLCGVLESKGIINSSFLFNVWVRMYADYGKFQAGTYRFEGSVLPTDIAATITKGKIYEPIMIQYTIPEGFTIRQFRERLAAQKVGTLAEIDAALKDKEFMKSLQLPTETFEGFIYPATYAFTKKATPREAIRRAVETFWEKLPADYTQQAAKMGLDLNEAVIMASLIELETLHDDEKPLVSEVIWRRIKSGIPLGIDAALIYGIQDYDGDIRWQHLKDAKNPYNTRIHVGLPPTAIGSPSISSLKAVLNPSNKGYYYYVLNADGENRHHFSKTFNEHREYVRKLVKASKLVKAGKDGAAPINDPN